MEKIETARIRDFLEGNGYQWKGDYIDEKSNDYHKYESRHFVIKVLITWGAVEIYNHDDFGCCVRIKGNSYSHFC